MDKLSQLKSDNFEANIPRQIVETITKLKLAHVRREIKANHLLATQTEKHASDLPPNLQAGFETYCYQRIFELKTIEQKLLTALHEC